MSTRIQSWVWFLTISLWCAQKCSTFVYKETNELKKLSDFCKTSECIVKCCPKNEIMLMNNCTSVDKITRKYGVKNLSKYDIIAVYRNNVKQRIAKSEKSLNDFTFIYVTNYTDNATVRLPFKEYLLENGHFVIRQANYWNQWVELEHHEFCLELEISASLSDNRTLVFTTPNVVIWAVPDPDSGDVRNRVQCYGFVVSCVFLLLVLVVYALLPELRTLGGLILMGCMSTYFALFLIRIIHEHVTNSNESSPTGCAALTVIFYYFLLATFCWINVMSFDTWWTFRSIKSCRSHRQSWMSKFRWYCAYAWGLPVLPTLFLVIVDRLDLTHIPAFIQPHLPSGETARDMKTCFLEPEIYRLYVSIPLLILICGNLIMFLLTAFNIWQVRRGIFYDFKQITNNRKNEYKFWLYLRLAMVMGVSWILEVVSTFVDPDSWWWCISDLYNSLCGLLIFILFVCRKKIFLRLCTRFSIDNKFVRWLRSDAGADALRKISSQTTNVWSSSANIRHLPDKI